MTQLGIGVAALNHDSVFQAAYEKGINKSDYWTYTLEDCVNLIARLPALAARIYRNVYKPDMEIPAIDKDLDLVGNYTNMLGYGNNKDLTEYLRLYISLHGDHEGGNASAHTARMLLRLTLDASIPTRLILCRLSGIYTVGPIPVIFCSAFRPRRTIARVSGHGANSRGQI